MASEPIGDSSNVVVAAGLLGQKPIERAGPVGNPFSSM